MRLCGARRGGDKHRLVGGMMGGGRAREYGGRRILFERERRDRAQCKEVGVDLRGSMPP